MDEEVIPVLGVVGDPSAVLVRPDGYVAWVAHGTDDGLAVHWRPGSDPGRVVQLSSARCGVMLLGAVDPAVVILASLRAKQMSNQRNFLYALLS